MSDQILQSEAGSAGPVVDTTFEPIVPDDSPLATETRPNQDPAAARRALLAPGGPVEAIFAEAETCIKHTGAAILSGYKVYVLTRGLIQGGEQ